MKTLALIAFAAALAVVVSACGGGGGGSPALPPTANGRISDLPGERTTLGNPAPQSSPTMAPVTVTIFIPGPSPTP